MLYSERTLRAAKMKLEDNKRDKTVRCMNTTLRSYRKVSCVYLIQVITLLTYIWEVIGSNIDWNTDSPEDYCCFSQANYYYYYLFNCNWILARWQ
jgi:hypothetical protein